MKINKFLNKNMKKKKKLYFVLCLTAVDPLNLPILTNMHEYANI